MRLAGESIDVAITSPLDHWHGPCCGVDLHRMANQMASHQQMPFAHQVDKSLDSTTMPVAVREFNKRSGKASTLQAQGKWTRWKDAPTRPKAGHLSVALFKSQAPRDAEPGRRSSRRGASGWMESSIPEWREGSFVSMSESRDPRSRKSDRARTAYVPDVDGDHE